MTITNYSKESSFNSCSGAFVVISAMDLPKSYYLNPRGSIAAHESNVQLCFFGSLVPELSDS